MKKVDLELDFRRKNGISIYTILKSIMNENNFSDEDFEFRFPEKKKNFSSYYKD